MRSHLLIPSAIAVVLASVIGCASGTDSNPSNNNAATCGNGTMEGGEQCDDGNSTPGDGCSATCQTEQPPPGCGNGTLDAGEQCDDGNNAPGDGCSSVCTKEAPPPGCGNGTLDPGEACDDGNTLNGDGCSSMCKTEQAPPGCGNGQIDQGEECDDGNTASGDGCSSVCKKETVTVVCATLEPLANGQVCEVTAGDGGRVITGDVLTPSAIHVGGQVVVDAQGKILYVGCDWSTDTSCDAACQAAAASATKVTCPKGVISPGLINTHDHITFAHNFPYNDTGERYEHRHDWRKGLHGHTKISVSGSASSDQVRWGELRFLMGGATSTNGSGSQPGILRNLDRDDQDGLNQKPVNYDTFPLGDSGGEQLDNGCGYPSPVNESSIASDDAYTPHVAEGINMYAENEFVCLSDANPGHNVLVDQSAYIHGVGLTASDYANMAANGTSLIWSPRTNITLYGDTAIVTEASRFGVLIALGTDWIATGSMNMLRELQCADSLNKTYFGGYFSDRDLWMMATANAAAVTGTDDVIGILAPNKVADIAIFDGAVHPNYRAVIDAEPKDVALVLRGGKVLYGDADVVSAIPSSGSCDTVDVCGKQKGLCLQDDIGKSYSALKSDAGNMYPAFFCGTPDKEPTCTPTRPTAVNGSSTYSGSASADDTDGDGVPNASDNCPTIFNPIRPMDGGKQADFDEDSVGDACDVCPLDANTSACTSFDPNDVDSDSIPNATDNCPKVANANQADADGDQKGDACDPCPNAPNPGDSGCPATIYDIKQGFVPVGSVVALTHQLVTGRTSKGFYLQIKPGDPDYEPAIGAHFSGIYVYDPTNTVAVGDRVTLSAATITNYYDQIELTHPTTTVVTSGNEAPPDPVVATPADVATGGSKAGPLESVIVQVQNVTVTDIAPAPGPGDNAPTNEFVVDGSLRVNDYLYLISPFPAVGQNYASLTGILDWRNGNSKLELRGPADVVGGAPVLIGFAPDHAFVRVGQTSVQTIPTPVTVTLSNATTSDTFVAVTSATPGALTVVGGGVTVLAGQASAPVLLNGVAQAADVKLTATLGTASIESHVRVLGAGEQPSLVSITPSSATVSPGATFAFTANLDIPANVGGAIVSLTLNPANAGTIPATVTIPANQISASFNYVDGNTVQSATITGALGSGTASANISISAASNGGLVINEVDYDMVGTDNAEWIEIYNAGNAPVSLSGKSLVLVNGANATVYATVDLSPAGTINPGQYLVVGVDAVLGTLPASVLRVSLGTGNDKVQNGSPDGIALIDTTSGNLLDALSYEGSITSVSINGIPGTVSLVEGNALLSSVADSNSAAGSLCRIPDGSDTDDAATDWKFCATTTPGAANVP